MLCLVRLRRLRLLQCGSHLARRHLRVELFCCLGFDPLGIVLVSALTSDPVILAVELFHSISLIEQGLTSQRDNRLIETWGLEETFEVGYFTASLCPA